MGVDAEDDKDVADHGDDDQAAQDQDQDDSLPRDGIRVKTKSTQKNLNSSVIRIFTF